MAYPVVYNVTYSYTNFQQSQQGVSAFPGTQLDSDLAGLRSSILSVDTFMQSVIRSDGALNNGIVTFDSLAPSLQTAGLTPANAWATGTSYALNANAFQNGSLYRAAVAHTSGVFATDLAAGKWTFVASLPLSPPTATTLGGVKSVVPVAHNWINSIGTDGTPAQSQPSFADISGSIAPSQMASIRQILVATLSLFVDSVNGNDGNNGLAVGAGHALQTLQGAINLLAAKYDIGGQTVLINTTFSGAYAPFTINGPFVGDAGQVFVIGSPLVGVSSATNANPSVLTASHDYANGDHVIISGAVGNTAINGAFKVANANIGAGTFTLLNENTGAAIAGNGAYTAFSAAVQAPSRVTLSSTNTPCVTVVGAGAAVTVMGFKLTSTNVQLMNAIDGGVINLGKNQYDVQGAGSAVAQLWATRHGRIRQTDYYSISGSGSSITNFAQASHLGSIRFESCIGTAIANLSYGPFLYALNGEIVTTLSPGGTPFNANGFTVTGQKWQQAEYGTVQIEGSSPPTDSLVLGSVNGAIQGSSFLVMSPAPSVAAGSGAFTSVAATGRYFIDGKRVYFSLSITITTNGTAASYINVTMTGLPNAAAFNAVPGKNFTNSKMVLGSIASGTNQVLVQLYDGTYSGADATTIILSGMYESA